MSISFNNIRSVETPDDTCSFERYRGMLWRDVAKNHPGFIKFLLAKDLLYIDQELYDLVYPDQSSLAEAQYLHIDFDDDIPF